jgi:peptidoglycan/LPS O-acetylase OafA/YrhL
MIARLVQDFLGGARDCPKLQGLTGSVDSLSKERYYSLDGLRGIAALSVVLFHFFSAYVPGLISEQTQTPWWGSDTPLAALYNGGFAVSIFFVLSGFVLSNSAARRASPLWFNLIQRYFRLAVPVLGGTLFSFLLLTLYPHTVSQLKAAGDHVWLGWVYDGQLPSLSFAISDALYGVFKHGKSMFDNVLWTMKIEMRGSIGIYVLYAIVRPNLRTPVLIAALAYYLGYTGQADYAAFAAGALMREFRHHLSPTLAWPALAFALVFGAMMQGYADRNGLPIWPGMLALGEPHQLWHVAAAVAAVYATLSLLPLKRMLGGRFGRFLGDISFGLYLVHVPLLYTVFVPLFLHARGSAWGMAGLLVAFIASSVMVGFAFTVFIDKPTMAVIRRAQHFLKTDSSTALAMAK